MKLVQKLGLAALAALAAMALMAGCQQDTNVITPEAVDKANQDRIKHIDNDPTLDPKTKDKMKQMMGLGSDGQGGRRGPPPGFGPK